MSAAPLKPDRASRPRRHRDAYGRSGQRAFRPRDPVRDLGGGPRRLAPRRVPRQSPVLRRRLRPGRRADGRCPSPRSPTAARSSSRSIGECALNRLDKLGILAFETDDPVDATVRQLGRLRRAVRAGDAMSAPVSSACPAHVMRAAAMTPAFPDLEGKHPCFSTTAEGHARAARLHLPVAPGCNIACAFCRRDFNRVEQRPGVAARLLSPDEAVGDDGARARARPEPRRGRDRRAGRPAGLGPRHRDLRPHSRPLARADALRLDQRPHAARARRRTRGGGRDDADGDGQLGRSGDPGGDHAEDRLEAQARERRRGRPATDRQPARRDRPRRPPRPHHQDQHGADPDRQRPSHRRRRGGGRCGRSADDQRHPADPRAPARASEGADASSSATRRAPQRQST